MGMTAVCSGGCGYSAPSNSHRGGRLGICPRCGKPMQAHTAGKSKGRYLCPISRSIVTLGLTGVQLAEPMRLTVANPDDGKRQLGPWERDWLTTAGDSVYGPGCVVTEQLDPDRNNSYQWTRAALIPAPGADSATWIVNQQLQYKKCAGCSSRVAVTEGNIIPEPWSPRRSYVWRGRRDVDTLPGPHPAGTVACWQCDPRRQQDAELI